MMITEHMDCIRQPLIESAHISKYVADFDTKNLLKVYSTMPVNIIGIGERQLTVAFAHQYGYISSFRTKVFTATRLIAELYNTICLYACVGSTIYVYHHDCGYIGQVSKSSESYLMPYKLVLITSNQLMRTHSLQTLPRLLEKELKTPNSSKVF